ncbi:hypothetical protein C1645_774373 [Glomus cerebriforme]|uniref:Uncharacterized protein n=1 Tax=Glomus cerebriforme TaxID=658196 RepID=A0A397T0M5_9GLOM|nr:hypothetical protein C1645_774373 [Glomus cerebriforme]
MTHINLLHALNAFSLLFRLKVKLNFLVIRLKVKAILAIFVRCFTNCYYLSHRIKSNYVRQVQFNS